MTRRRLTVLLAAAAAGFRLPLQAQLRRKPAPPAEPLVYFGCDTSKGAKGIYKARFDSKPGRFSALMVAAETLRPAFLARNQISVVATQAQSAKRSPRPVARHLLYACNEGDARSSTISSFGIDEASGDLTPLGQVSAGGDGPCYIAVDATGRSAYVANYAGGSVASYLVGPDGRLSEPVDRVDFHEAAIFGPPGPNKARQDGPHPHSAMLSPDNRFLVVNDLGNDRIAIFPVDAATARLGKPHLYEAQAGAGPRHLAFHPNGRWAYGIDELTSRVDQYLFNAMHGGAGIEPQAVLTDAGHSISTLDAGFHGVNTAAEIALSPEGSFLYASNRGDDSLVVFAVDADTGALRARQRIGCGGRTPRHFTLDPTGRWIICGNQDSGTITIFARNGSSGELTGPVQTVALPSPMFTLFV